MLQIQALSHEYKNPAGKARRILQGINWTIEAGEQVLLRGVSGSGKTSLFNILAGLMKPTEGNIHFNSSSLYELSEAARDKFRSKNIAYVFQNHYLINTLSALENVIMPMAFAQNGTNSQRKERAYSLLEQVGLGHHATYFPKQLSTGQRMRVAIARALANKPHLILADEPSAALDLETSTQVMDLMQTVAQETQAILIVSSHDPSLLERFHKIASLELGNLFFEERPAQ